MEQQAERYRRPDKGRGVIAALAVLVAEVVAVVVGARVSGPAEEVQFCAGASLPGSDVTDDSSLYHLIRPQQQRRRDREAESFRGSQ